MAGDDCIETDWWRDERGYGRKMFPNPAGKWRSVRAHREVLRELHVPIAGMEVRHRCDNPPCVNPDHLTVGTHFDNMRDMVERGRSSRLKGESNGRAALTEIDVRNIRDHHRLHDMRQVDIADMYGIAQTAVSAIVRHRTWKNVA